MRLIARNYRLRERLRNAAAGGFTHSASNDAVGDAPRRIESLDDARQPLAFIACATVSRSESGIPVTM
jgi:hypothetical protein